MEVLQMDDLKKNGMNLFIGVGQGAESPPRLVIFKYMGNPDSKEVDLAIVGKGITYDTGGLNLKRAVMEKMYGDKGGACSCIGAIQGVCELKVKKNIVFACAFADNAIGPKSYKPGDIIKAMNGLTVDI